MTSKRNCGFVVQFVVLSDLWWLVSGLGSMSSIAISYGEKGPAFCGIKSDGSHLVNCYGSNSAIIHETPAYFPFIGLTAGDGFVCGLLLESNRPYCWGSSGYLRPGVPQPMMEEAETVFCWGDQASSRVISLIPQEMRFQKIAAGGYHVCGILEGVDSRAFCWGRSLDLQEEISVISAAYLNQGNVDLPPSDPLLSVVGGKFHACGIKSSDREVICWGYIVKPSTPTPAGIKVYEIAAGNYFTCGILAEKSLQPVCWGLGFPSSLPLAVSPGLCKTTPCPPGSFEFVGASTPCTSPGSRACLSCSNGCPAEMYQKTKCNSKSDRQCDYNCSSCYSSECFSNCSSLYSNNAKEKNRFWSLQLPVIIAEIGFAMFLVVIVTTTAILYVRYRLRNCQCSAKQSKTKKNSGSGSSVSKDNGRIRPYMDEIKLRRAQIGRKAIDMQYEEGNIVEWAVPLIKAGDISAILDPVLKPPSDPEALKRIANVACKCVRMRGKERPSMDKVTTALERALAQLMGSPSHDQPILPTEVVLGSSRLHKKSSQRSSNRSAVSETDVVEGEDQRIEFRAPSWITFPSVTSSQGRKSSASDADVDGKTSTRNLGYVANAGDGLRSLEEEIGPASPQERLFLQHNF
ncbi:hypothetical protein D5086_030102 [Populus alba]|uniref:Uncharacterized protein n=1 Tax=Populus alba TaxID=43335 RepID=A0ACC4AN63_POPAL